MNVDHAEFQTRLLIITRYGKQDLIYEIEAALISYALEQTWVLTIVISKTHDYGINIYKEPINHFMKRASTSNSPKVSFGILSSFKRHRCIYNYHDYPLNVPG